MPDALHETYVQIIVFKVAPFLAQCGLSSRAYEHGFPFQHGCVNRINVASCATSRPQ